MLEKRDTGWLPELSSPDTPRTICLKFCVRQENIVGCGLKREYMHHRFYHLRPHRTQAVLHSQWISTVPEQIIVARCRLVVRNRHFRLVEVFFPVGRRCALHAAEFLTDFALFSPSLLRFHNPAKQVSTVRRSI